MLECLVALVVLSCMCQLFQLMIQQSFIGNQYLKNNDSKSWHIFLIQLEKECQKLVFQTGSAQEISFLDSETNKTISIQIKEDKIIKRVNGKGYQPLLIGIKNGQFKNEGQSFTLEVTFTSGKTFDSFFPIKENFNEAKIFRKLIVHGHGLCLFDEFSRPSVTRRTSVNTKIYASYPGILCREKYPSFISCRC